MVGGPAQDRSLVFGPQTAVAALYLSGSKERRVQVSPDDLETLLAQRFGHDAFRPGQERIVRDLLDGRDVLAVLPTGAGKSLVYELAAQFLPGVTIVVTPLLALMQDQMASMEAIGVEAGAVSSVQSAGATEDALEKAEQGEQKLLYVTPERFENAAFMDQARGMQVSLLVVDEAHCISQWGHSFRPAYLLLGDAARQLGRPTLLALTATAAPMVRQEIIDRLGMRGPDVVVQGVDRANLFLEVRRVDDEREDRGLLEELMTGDGDRYPSQLGERLRQAMQGSGIIYTATTKAARQTARWLTEWGIAADYYHGQRKKADRLRVQEAFMADELRVIVATNAFGLGIDKPDIRFVLHRDVPANLEAYYQEAGRAGRDGEFARCVLIYRPAELGRAAFLAGSAHLTRDDVARGREGLLKTPNGTLRELEAATGLSKADLAGLLGMLKKDGIVAERRGRVRLLVPDFDVEQVALEDEEERKAYERSRWEMMRAYAETESCRRRFILTYFGEAYEPSRCDHCDNDVLHPAAAEPDAAATEADIPFAMQTQVTHATFGDGVVQRVDGDTITVLFDTVGYKTLSSALVEEQGLLKATLPGD
jgi:ATP-dependent DNA helicase RecQ